MIGLTVTSPPSRRPIGKKPIGQSKKLSILGGKFDSLLIYLISLFLTLFRIQKYERDLKRWEYMEEEQDREG